MKGKAQFLAVRFYFSNLQLEREPSGYFNYIFMKLMMTFILFTVCLTATAQITSTRNWVDTEVKYTDSVGNVILVHNSYPKGGGGTLIQPEKITAM